MAKIARFEEIEAWQKARTLTQGIYHVTSRGEFARDYGLRDLIRRSAVSIMSNIAEGFDREGNKELIQSLTIAKGSTSELKSQLYVAVDASHIPQQKFDELFVLSEEVTRLIGGFIRHLKASDLRGRKYV
jgi:four helix bundle protein